ncbi:MAG: alpha/beta fold hydrolase, partial [Chloroflexota bacterium]
RNTHKTIVWADQKNKKQTKTAVVYVHGFSSSRQETAPLCDRVAAQLNANLFYTRLTGHGQTGYHLGEATVDDWFRDVAEAIEIGRYLGEKVVLVGNSTGSTLLAWLAATGQLVRQPSQRDDIAALVLMSPNTGLRAAGSELLTMPFAKQMLRIVEGETQEWDAFSPKHAAYWTLSYPSKALIPMMETVKLLRRADISKIQQPVLMIYSPNDQVVDPKTMQTFFNSLETPHRELILMDEVQDRNNHVLAGDALSPDTTDEIAEHIIHFVKPHLD